MNWNRFANNLSAFLTGSIIAFDCEKTEAFPVATSIGLNTSNPMRGVFTGIMLFEVFNAAINRAKNSLMVASHLMRLAVEHLVALDTSKFNRFNPFRVILTLYLLRSKCIRWAQSLTVGIALDTMVSGLIGIACPSSLTGLTTEARRIFTGFYHLVFFATLFTYLCYSRVLMVSSAFPRTTNLSRGNGFELLSTSNTCLQGKAKTCGHAISIAILQVSTTARNIKLFATISTILIEASARLFATCHELNSLLLFIFSIPRLSSSGSTLVACVQEGFHFIGIEQEDEYVEIAGARIAHAMQRLRS